MSSATAGHAAVLGGQGFLGWHLSCRIRAISGEQLVRLGRAAFRSPEGLAADIAGASVVYHLAGVNRAEDDAEVEEGNLDLARTLGQALDINQAPVHVVYANSIQAATDTPYGRGKSGAAAILAEATGRLGGTFADVHLPNLFGEHGRPSYNSFVATFCHEVAAGRQPQVIDDRSVPLLHAQRAAQTLINVAGDRRTALHEPTGEEQMVSEVLARVRGYHGLYASGEIPSLADSFDRDLFNTYRSYVFPGAFPHRMKVHSDVRGDLFEAVRSHGGTGQSFVSTTAPGSRRGDHYHLHKVERFLVVRGEAEIALRRLFDREVVRFRVGGDEPAFVDMPTMWVHSIENVGQDDLITLFWSDQLLDAADPDQYPEQVEPT